MSILVCGGAGYIGSHVNKELNKEGYDTVVFDSLVRGHEESVKWGFFVKGDLKNTDDLDMVFSKYSISTVVHLAGYAYVGESYNNPEEYYCNNVANTLNLLKVMRKHNCKRIVFSSTCATYGDAERVPIDETVEQHPISPYGASKFMVERILKDYNKAYGFQYVILRFFNAAGADPDGEIGESHNNETHLIPLLLEAASGQKDSFEVYGNDYVTPDGSCIRDFVHVTDLAKAHLLALRYLESGDASNDFNLGTDSGYSVFNIVDTVKRVTNKDFCVNISKRRSGDPAILVADSKKAMKMLGWSPSFNDITEIITHAWRWYQNRLY